MPYVHTHKLTHTQKRNTFEKGKIPLFGRGGGGKWVVGQRERRRSVGGAGRCKSSACRRQASPRRVGHTHSALLFSWCPTVDRVASLRACPPTSCSPPSFFDHFFFFFFFFFFSFFKFIFLVFVEHLFSNPFCYSFNSGKSNTNLGDRQFITCVGSKCVCE